MPAATQTQVSTMYWLPHCSTCQKAEAWLKDHGITIAETIDVKTQNVPKTTIEQLAQKLGGAEALFSKRALKFRAMGLHEKTLTPDELIDYMAQEYTFIKRPVIVLADGRVHAGFSEKQYKMLFGV
ncbi:MAG: arsenate reductase family protein [Vampirovibrionales bacterium]|nr:arsenate reductase family protein [Vampirovibrionales bacterium]